jgi:amino acid transporter
MAAAGVLPKRLAHVSPRAIPAASTLLALGLLVVLVSVGTLPQVAALTDAAVLVSFMLVNASLPWLAGRWRTPARGAVRAIDLVLPSLGFLLCAWLLVHAGVTSIVVALVLSAVLLAATWAIRALSESAAPGLGRRP